MQLFLYLIFFLFFLLTSLNQVKKGTGGRLLLAKIATQLKEGWKALGKAKLEQGGTLFNGRVYCRLACKILSLSSREYYESLKHATPNHVVMKYLEFIVFFSLS